MFLWQGQQGSNPRPTVLETVALPAELYPYLFLCLWLFMRRIKRKSEKLFTLRQKKLPVGSFPLFVHVPSGRHYSMILETTPEPTVRPPSRMAKRSFSSIAMGAISSTSNFRLSPGITISVPAGRFTVPVTSVVRK